MAAPDGRAAHATTPSGAGCAQSVPALVAPTGRTHARLAPEHLREVAEMLDLTGIGEAAERH